MPNLTSAEIAALLRSRDALATYAETSRTHRQIRNLHAKGLLPDAGVRDDRRTAEFSPDSIPRAAILTALADHGFDARTLRAIVEAMDQNTLTYTPVEGRAPSLKSGRQWRSEGGLNDAIKGIRAGESWSLRIGTEAGEERTARFAWDGEPESPEAAEIAKDYATARNVSYVVTSVHLNPLLSPLLDRE